MKKYLCISSQLYFFRVKRHLLSLYIKTSLKLRFPLLNIFHFLRSKASANKYQNIYIGGRLYIFKTYLRLPYIVYRKSWSLFFAANPEY